MSMKTIEKGQLDVLPVTPEHWKDMERLFGDKGACGGCWCMWWRIKRSEFDQQKGEGNKEAMRKIVERGEIPGLLAFFKEEPIAWCSIAPRETFPVLERSRILKRIDDRTVWSIVCFFVTRTFRHRGISVKLIESAVTFAAERGARIIEGYPVAPKKEHIPEAFAWTGLEAAFRKSGFVEVIRRSETRPIMRYYLNKNNSYEG